MYSSTGELGSESKGGGGILTSTSRSLQSSPVWGVRGLEVSDPTKTRRKTGQNQPHQAYLFGFCVQRKDLFVCAVVRNASTRQRRFELHRRALDRADEGLRPRGKVNSGLYQYASRSDERTRAPLLKSVRCG